MSYEIYKENAKKPPCVYSENSESKHVSSLTMPPTAPMYNNPGTNSSPNLCLRMSPSVLTSSLLLAASQDTRDLKPEAPPLVSKNKYKKDQHRAHSKQHLKKTEKELLF